MFIEGAKVSVTYSLPTADIAVTAESGTDIIIFVDYGDNETIQKSWYASADLVQPFSNDYAPEIPLYQANVTLSNDFNYTLLTHQICNFLPVAGTITTQTQNVDISVNYKTQIEMQFTAGKMITLTADMGDSQPVVLEYTLYTDIPNPFAYEYTRIGKFDVNITVCNCHNCLYFELVSLVGIPIKDFIYKPDPVFSVDDNGTFTVSLGNSSETTCVFTFGDGEHLTMYKIFTEQAITVQHAYYSPGTYMTQIFCGNLFGNVSDSAAVEVQIPVYNLTINGESTRSIPTGSSLSLPFHLERGTSVQYAADCDGLDCGTVTKNDELSGVLLLDETSWPTFGTFNVTLNASNKVSEETAHVFVSVDQPIESAYFIDIPDGGLVNEEIAFQVAATTGTRINFQMSFGDSEDLYGWLFPDESLKTYVYHTWNETGVYLVTVTAVNNVSTSSSSRQVFIEHPLPNSTVDLFSNATNVTDIADMVRVTGRLDGGVVDPTSVNISCDYGDGTLVDAIPVPLTVAADGDDFSVRHKYDVFGQFTINCTLFNHVSQLVFTMPVAVGVEITGLNISSSLGVVSVGRTIVFKLHVDSGSDLNYTIDTGDGYTTGGIKRSSTDWVNPDDTEFSYQYAEPNSSYTVKVTATNPFGTVGPVTLSHTILVDYAIPELTLITAPYHDIDKNVVFVLKQAKATDHPPGIPVFCNWTLNGVSSDSLRQANELATPASHLYSTTVSEVGNYTMVVECANLVSSANATVSFEVEKTISALTVIAPLPAVNYSDEVLLELSPDTGSPIQYTVSFGDGTIPENVTRVNNRPITLRHVYQSVGVYNISVSASNHVSNESSVVTLSVQHPFIPDETTVTVLDSVSGVANKTAIRDGVAGQLAITISLRASAIEPSIPFVNITFTGYGEPRQDRIPNFPYKIMSPGYSTTGDYELIIILHNLVSSLSYIIPIQVQEYPHEPTISVTTWPVIFTFPLDIFEVNVTYGSHYKLTADFGDGHTENVTVGNERGFKTFNFSGYVYPKPGYYTVKAIVRNEFVDLVAEKKVIILGKLPNMTLVTNSPVELKLDGNLLASNFTLEINPEDRLPIDCNLNVDFGDGQDLNTDTSIREDITWTHVYDVPKYYNVHINVSTAFDYKYFENIMSVQIPLSEITLRMTIPDETEEKDVYMVGTAVQFSAIHSSGTGANYTWTITNKDTLSVYHTEVTTVSRTVCIMAEAGTFSIEVVADNGVGERQNATGDLRITPNGIIAEFKYPATTSVRREFYVQLSLVDQFSAETNSFNDLCIRFQLGSDTVWISSVDTYCIDLGDEEFRSSVQEVRILPGSRTYNISHTFREVGLHSVFVEVTNRDGRFHTTSTGSINVTEYCNPPKLDVKPSFQRLVAFRYEPILVLKTYFTAEIDCVSTTEIHTNFELYQYTNHTSGQLGDVDLTTADWAVEKSDGLYLEPLKLEVGFYAVVFTMGMGSQEEQLTSLEATSQLVLEVIPTDFTASFQCGIYQQVRSPDEVRLVVEVNNPDQPDDVTGYVYTWFCYQFEVESAWADDNVTLPTRAERIAIPTNDSRLGSGPGGCFDTGPGMLLVQDDSSDTLVLNTGFMFANLTYAIDVIVSKNGKSATAKTRIALKDTDFVDLSVKCKGINCFRKAKLHDMYLAANCSTCPKDVSANFVWRLDRVEKAARKRRSVVYSAEQKATQVTSVSIPPYTLVEGSYYWVVVEVTTVDGEQGTMYYEFYINFRPRSGTCGSDIKEGDASTVFTFTCTGWEDEGQTLTNVFEPVPVTKLRYTFSYFSSGKEYPLSSSSTTLPSGDPDNDYAVTVRGYVTDIYSSSATYDFTVKVTPLADSKELASALDKVEDNGIQQLLLNLDSNLDTLALTANEINKHIEALKASGKYIDPDLDKAYAPAGGLEEAMEQQRQDELLEVVDQAVSLYKDILANDEVVLSPDSLSNAVQSLSTVNIPLNPLPKTMNSMFDIISSVGDKMSDLDINLNDPHSVSRAVKLVNNTAAIISHSLAAASDMLLHQPITNDDLSDAIFDVPMTEEEEEQRRLELKEREDNIAKVKTKALDSLFSTIDSMTRVMAATTANYTQVTTDALNAAVAVIDNLKNDTLTTLPPQQMGEISSQIAFSSAGIKPSGFLVTRSFVVDKSTFGVGEGADVNGPVVMFKIFSVGSKSIEQVKGVKFSLVQKLEVYDEIPLNCSEDIILDEDTGMWYISATLRNHSIYTLDIKPQQTTDVAITIYVIADCVDIIECRPNKTHYNYKKELPIWNQTNPWQASFPDLSGTIYVGIDIRVSGENALFSPNFCLKTGSSRCRVYDSDQHAWLATGSSLSDNSELGSPQCNFVTSPSSQGFSSGFTVPTVNPIDFKRIFANFAQLLAANPAVFVTVFLALGIYAVLAVWARRKDRKDVEKWSVLPLVGTQPRCNNFYKISVFTGMRRWSGTKSNIFFILSGETTDTGVRELRDASNREFSTGSIRHFTLATENPLGHLVFLRIWHDNSGKGDHASWFLDKIVVEDLQTKYKYFFLCGRWLAVDEDDGLIDRLLPVAGRDDILRFQHLFFDKARMKLFDDHLWLSVLGRPARSNFTRLQRLTCILCLFFTTMIANAMWYERVEVANDRVLTIGIIKISAATIVLSIFGSLTVVPINMIIMNLFRKHRPKDWPAEDQVLGVDGKLITVKQVEGSKPKVKWWKKKYPLPYWCAYLAWTLAILCTLTGVFFIIMYSLQWGKEKADAWLLSLILSTLQSVFLTEPAKVILLAAVVALIFKTLDDDDDVDVRYNNATPSLDEELTDKDLLRLDELVKQKTPEPLDSEKLAAARQKRETEKKSWIFLKESTFYFLYLTLLCFITWGSRHPMLYRSNQALLAEMAGGDLSKFTDTVTDGNKFWNWSRNVLIDNLFYMKHYNGRPGTPRDRKYLSDGINLRVGPLLMRQVRVKPDSCDVLPAMRRVFSECRDVYSFIDEEDQDFALGWQPIAPDDNRTEDELTRAEQAYRFRSFTELKTIPFWGRFATYGGGGYVANLGTTKGQAAEVLDQLLENDWYDSYTRAVFVEFTVYNPNINMFAYINYLVEAPAIGAIIASAKVSSFQLYTRLTGMNTLIVAGQIIYMILIVYFMVRETLLFRRIGNAYWKDPWNYIEIVVICLSWAALAIYLVREAVGRHVMDQLMKNKEQYSNYSLFGYYDEVQWYVIGLIVFMSNIKFLRLLRFNKHLAYFAGTLSHSSKDLMGFSLSFAIIFLAFSSCVYLLSSTDQEAYSTFIGVLESLFSMLIGKFDVGDRLMAESKLEPLIFGCYVVLVYFITINLFLAIIGEAYDEVQKNPNLVPDDHKVIEYIVDKTFNFLGISRNKHIVDGNSYLDIMKTLETHLDALDRLVTEDCRAILGFERQALMNERRNNNPEADKQSIVNEEEKKVKSMALFAKLQQHCVGSSRPTSE